MSSPVSRRAATRSVALTLYRRCLRSAARCPAYEQRQFLLIYARNRFREARAERDPARVARLLAEGEDEWRVMESMHAAKARAEADAARAIEAFGAPQAAAGAGAEAQSGTRVVAPQAQDVLPPPLAPLRAPPPLWAPAPAAARTPLPSPLAAAAASAELEALFERVNVLIGGLALDAAAEARVARVSLHVDAAAAAMRSDAPAAAAALAEARAAIRELQGAGAGQLAAEAQAGFAALSLALKRLFAALDRRQEQMR
jgi:hypothetical protein